VASNGRKEVLMSIKGGISQRIENTNPERYKAIVKDLKAGKSLQATMHSNDAGNSSVSRIKDALLAKGELPDWKKRTASKARQVAERLIDKIDRELDDKSATLKDCSISAAVLLDKSLALETGGNVLGVIEHRHSIEAPKMDGWIGTQNAPKAAEVVEIGGKVGKEAGFENLGSDQEPGRKPAPSTSDPQTIGGGGGG